MDEYLWSSGIVHMGTRGISDMQRKCEERHIWAAKAPLLKESANQRHVRYIKRTCGGESQKGSDRGQRSSLVNKRRRVINAKWVKIKGLGTKTVAKEQKESRKLRR